MTSLGPKTTGRTLDHVAKVYDLLSPLMLFGIEKKLSRKVIELLALKGCEHILDVGCGTGTLTMELARQLDESRSMVIGIDAAPKMIIEAEKKIKSRNNIRFDTAVAESLPYPDSSFDVIVSTFFFHHIDEQLKIKSLSEIRRVLKPGGKVIIIDVDVPSNIFGAFCAWCGYILFMQNEIKENIQGKLRTAVGHAGFEWQLLSQHLGYISVVSLKVKGV